MAYDNEIFKGKTMSDLFSEIYTNSKNTKTQVRSLIDSLKDLIDGVGDATLIVPLIKEYLDIGVKNDEHLLKLATVVQRIEATQARGGSDDDFDFSELQDLLQEQETEQLKLEEQSKANDETKP